MSLPIFHFHGHATNQGVALRVDPTVSLDQIQLDVALKLAIAYPKGTCSDGLSLCVTQGA